MQIASSNMCMSSLDFIRRDIILGKYTYFKLSLIKSLSRLKKRYEFSLLVIFYSILFYFLICLWVYITYLSSIEFLYYLIFLILYLGLQLIFLLFFLLISIYLVILLFYLVLLMLGAEIVSSLIFTFFCYSTAL